ncbi:MAG: hypothetical protein MI919_31395, partial [Holophagales bacterium]|nr:hypothetical protein [Holophagales bacterium]
MPRSNLVLAAVVIGLASANPDVARGQGDRLALTPDSSSSVVSEAGLPRGNWTETGHEIASRALAFGPDGKLYFIRNDPPGGAGKLLLSRLESNGEITDVSDLREGEDWIGDSVRDMTFGPEGRLYLLTLEYGGGYEWDLVLYAFERDIFELLYRSYLARGLSSSFRGEGLAPAPGGLWLLAQNRVSRFFFEGRVLLDSGSDLELSGRIHAA